jgi:hypothetical protein
LPWVIGFFPQACAILEENGLVSVLVQEIPVGVRLPLNIDFTGLVFDEDVSLEVGNVLESLILALNGSGGIVALVNPAPVIERLTHRAAVYSRPKTTAIVILRGWAGCPNPLDKVVSTSTVLFGMIALDFLNGDGVGDGGGRACILSWILAGRT